LIMRDDCVPRNREHNREVRQDGNRGPQRSMTTWITSMHTSFRSKSR
jgi:hypothetical protein